jgi:hypothetical protein
MPTIEKTIAYYESLPSSVNGNPRWRFVFSDGTEHYSMSDAGWCYAVGDPGIRKGSTVDLELTRAGRIRHMRATSHA